MLISNEVGYLLWFSQEKLLNTDWNKTFFVVIFIQYSISTFVSPPPIKMTTNN